MQIVHAGGAGHSALAGFLSEQSANVLICGGIGEGAQEALKEAGVLLADGTTSSSASGALTDLKKNDVQCFKKGNTDGKFICYYPYWIKHLPSADTAEDVMEFGIVRNNVYQVTVTGIQGVGKDGVTEDIITDTETDDPTTVLLNVKLSIKPWVVRANSAVLGR